MAVMPPPLDTNQQRDLGSFATCRFGGRRPPKAYIDGVRDALVALGKWDANKEVTFMADHRQT